MEKEKSDIYKRVKNGGINGSPAQMQVRIHPVGRALEWHSRGQRFDPAYLHQDLKSRRFRVFFLAFYHQKRRFSNLVFRAHFAERLRLQSRLQQRNIHMDSIDVV